MRIPEASANAGPYYSEENGPWQNGVIMDGAHAAGAAGDAAYAHPAHIYTQPQRPPHMQPGPGYIVPGAPYYAGYVPPAPPPDDFSDYMWMENEEEFDKQVMQQLEEEALMEQCIEAMLEDERSAGERERVNGHGGANGGPGVSLEEQVSKSTLNPLAAEFVPTRSTVSIVPTVSAEKAAPVEVSANDVVADIKDKSPETPAQTETVESKDETNATDAKAKAKESKKSEDSKAKTEPKKPEVKKDKAKNETKPIETKPKTEVKQVKSDKPAKAKSEIKVTQKSTKKDVRSAKSEVKVDAQNHSKVEKTEQKPVEAEVVAPVQDAIKTQPAATPEPSVAAAAPAFKPINYAAAARANKPRKPSDPAVTPAGK